MAFTVKTINEQLAEISDQFADSIDGMPVVFLSISGKKRDDPSGIPLTPSEHLWAFAFRFNKAGLHYGAQITLKKDDDLHGAIYAIQKLAGVMIRRLTRDPEAEQAIAGTKKIPVISREILKDRYGVEL